MNIRRLVAFAKEEQTLSISPRIVLDHISGEGSVPISILTLHFNGKSDSDSGCRSSEVMTLPRSHGRTDEQLSGAKQRLVREGA
jgi:hypothetical protein